jgi:hypothetical protein
MADHMQSNGLSRRGFLTSAAAAVVAIPVVGSITPNDQIDFRDTPFALPQQSDSDDLIGTGEGGVPVIDLRRAYVRGQAIDVSLRSERADPIARTTFSLSGTVDNNPDEDFTVDVKLRSLSDEDGNFTVRIHFFNKSIEHVQLIDNLIEIDFSSEEALERTRAAKYKTVIGEEWSDGPREITFTRIPERFRIDIAQVGDVARVSCGWAVNKGDYPAENFSIEELRAGPWIERLESFDVPVKSFADVTVTSNVSRESKPIMSCSLHTMDKLSVVNLDLVVDAFETIDPRNVPDQSRVGVQIVRPGYVDVQRFTTQTDPDTREATEFEDVLIVEPSTGHVEIYSAENLYSSPYAGTKTIQGDPEIALGVLQPLVHRDELALPFGVRVQSGTYRGIDTLGASVAYVKKPNVSDSPQFVWLQPIMKSIADYSCGSMGEVLARNEDRRQDFLDVTDEYDEGRRFLTPTDLMIQLGHTDDLEIAFYQDEIEGVFDFKTQRRITVAGSDILRGKCDIPKEFDLSRTIEVGITRGGDYIETFSSVVNARELEYPTVELGQPTPTFCVPLERIV